MLTFAAVRARAQWRLLAALLGVAAVGATLLGVCTLLLTDTGQRALEVAAGRAEPADVEVTAYMATIRGGDARAVAADTRALLTSTLAPVPAATSGRASSVMRTLPTAMAGPSVGPSPAPAVGYLSAVEDLTGGAELTAGRWPRGASAPGAGPLEAVVLEPTARSLGLSVGDRVPLGAELTRDGDAPLDVVVVGVARPRPGAGWERDPLRGAGVDFTFDEGTANQPSGAYGPFLVDFTDLLASGSTLSRMEFTARPDLSGVRYGDLDAIARAVDGADRRLARILADRAGSERVASGLPSTLATEHRHQRVTDALVLAVATLGGALTAVALVLAGRLTADVRAEEHALLVTMGIGRRRLALLAAGEGAVLALLAAAVAVPASSAGHAALTRLPTLAAAGLATAPRLTGGQVLTVAVCVLSLVVLLTAPAMRDPLGRHRRDRPAAAARSGADLLLVVLAVAGWWQLRTQSAQSVLDADAVRTFAPAVLLLGAGWPALRLVRPVLTLLDRLAARSSGPAWPLAVAGAARRPPATAAGLLVITACATATFGIALHATWERSQRDQADLAVGTDLSVAVAGSPAAGDGAALLTATGGVLSPATDRSIAVGQWLGAGGDATRLVAVDTTRAGDLLRGRSPAGRSWSDVAAGLTPVTGVSAVAVPPGAAYTITGDAGPAAAMVVTPTLLIEDGTGLRSTCTGGRVELDGRAHPLPSCTTARGGRLLAVLLSVTGGPAGIDPAGTDPTGADPPEAVQLTVTLAVAAAGAGDAAWTAGIPNPAAGSLVNAAVTVTGSGAQALVRMSMTVPAGASPRPRAFVATAFPDPGVVPVAISEALAKALHARPGTQLDLTIGDSAVPVVVTEVVPAVPSAPGGAAVLADVDAVSRALAVQGDLTAPVDAWWVGHPDRADAAGRAAALHLGAVTTRAAENTRRTAGPVVAGLPAVLWGLVPAVAVLLFAGIVLHVPCDLQARARDSARLQGLGMTLAAVRAVLLGRHALLLVPLGLAGAAAGAVATALLTPLLVRSDTGGAPDPGVVVQWPWPAEILAFAVLVSGCLAAAGIVVAVRTRRVDAADLRTAS
ncbi:permease [Dactylosporangium vinaceum]|uniref:Permease n=1 Tax=Dactylosporangium vinaceum TaxID=53362 RepID=A0ABV5M8U2_9ACTN|nr:permease [Dactylosporangium vinaceum]UAB99535.1 permease [Dactylosporangium vinaceum]